MIKRRSLYRRKSSKKQQSNRKKRKSRRIKRSSGFGSKIKQKSKIEKISEHLSNKDKLFKLFSNFVNPKDLINLMIFTDNISNNTLKQITPDENTEFHTIKEKFERFIIKLFGYRINNFVDKITPAQIVLLSEGKYTNELKKMLLFGKIPSSADEKIQGFKENSKLLFLKSIFARNLIKNIKIYIKSLTPTQLVLLINGKFDIGNAMFNSFLHTEYPTSKKIKNDIDQLDKEIDKNEI
jgi:hypothetical protein